MNQEYDTNNDSNELRNAIISQFSSSSTSQCNLLDQHSIQTDEPCQHSVQNYYNMFLNFNSMEFDSK